MKDALEELGLSKNEVIIYSDLLDHGLSSAYTLSKRTKVYKANAYEALRRLESKSFVSKIIIGKKTLYEASDPTFLKDYFRKKEESLAKLIANFSQIKDKSKRSFVTIYEGIDSTVKTLYHFLDFKEPILVYGAPKKAYLLLGHRLVHFHKERIQKKILMKHIYNFEAMERVKQIKNMPYTTVRSLPKSFDSKVSTNVCGDEVAFFFFDPVKVVCIKDKDLAQSYKHYFKVLWDKAKKLY